MNFIKNLKSLRQSSARTTSNLDLNLSSHLHSPRGRNNLNLIKKESAIYKSTRDLSTRSSSRQPHIFRFRSRQSLLKLYIKETPGINCLLGAACINHCSFSTCSEHNPRLIMGDSSLRDQFLSAFPVVVETLKGAPALSQLPEMQQWIQQVLEYNVQGGKLNRGLAVVESYKALMADNRLDENELQLAVILGWAVELLQAFFLVADDIMDDSHTRRNQPCWFRTHGLGVKAFNDSILLESAVYQLLAVHLKGKPYYTAVLDLFHDVTMRTSLGQAMDLLSAPNAGEKPNLQVFTKEKYDSIVTYKTAYYSFYLPVALAMHMAGLGEVEDLKTAESILLPMGHFFQVQDDFLDCFGDPHVTGKQGTDIEDGKCSWLVINALQKCGDQQKQILQDCYGCKDEASVARVKNVYEELGLGELYARYEEDSYREIQTQIASLNGRLPAKMFSAFASKIYKRKA